MKLENVRELENTRTKLRQLEEQYEAARRTPNENQYGRDLELRSLKELINQLKEEIVRCESRMRDRAELASK
jgi:hypothetical protein